ncbi:MAG: leucine-rich repeat domain-containing protein [Synergistaceae bacterium]|nr:leucine-rich repeat domain-containing protein [Synergistaceae bacterium]
MLFSDEIRATRRLSGIYRLAVTGLILISALILPSAPVFSADDTLLVTHETQGSLETEIEKALNEHIDRAGKSSDIKTLEIAAKVNLSGSGGGVDDNLSGDWGFLYNLREASSLDNITNLKITGAGVTEIPNFALFNARVGCPWLKNLEIPNITRIGEAAFVLCKELESVVIASGEDKASIRTIEAGAFSESGIKSFTIPASVTDIGRSAFSSCKRLKSVTFESGAKFSKIPFGMLSESGIESAVIPESVKIIDNGAFFGCADLREITFEGASSLELISNDAFCRSGVESIVIPAPVRTIGDSAFWLCKNLASVTFAGVSSLESLGEGSFSGIAAKSLTLPPSLTHIADGAFYECENLKEIVFSAAAPPKFEGTDIFAKTAIESIIIPHGTGETYKPALESAGWTGDVKESEKPPAKQPESLS